MRVGYKTMDIQRLRNLTTGILHTNMGHVYKDLHRITGWHEVAYSTMLPRVRIAVEPWLREHVTDPRFWDGKWDTTHTGEYELPDPTKNDRAVMLQRYKAQPDPLVGKDITTVRV